MQPFGSTGWRPFRDIETEEFIKVEEFIDGDHLVIRAELPGVEPDRDIDVSVDDSVLTIAAERQESSRKKLDKGGYRSEFRLWEFHCGAPRIASVLPQPRCGGHRVAHTGYRGHGLSDRLHH